MGRQIFRILVAFALSCCLALASSAAAIAPHRFDYTAAATATITVNAANIIGPVDQRMFGINTAIWDSAFNTDTTRSMFQEMGVQALRFPGGSLSDEYHWSTNTSRNNTWTWATSFDAFASVALTTRAQVYITANYGSGTAQEASDWVRYSNIAKGYNFKYWEVGNENYGSWEYDTHAATWDPYTYAVSFRDYVTLMKAADPSIKVGAVVTTGEDSYINNTNHPAVNPRTGRTHNGWTPVMLATLKSLGVTPDFAIYHRYEQAPGQESDSLLLQSAKSWPNDAANLRQQLTDYLGAAGSNVELVVTEHNSVYSNPGKQTTNLVNGLFMADSLGQILKTEFKALLWWDLRNGQENNNNNSSSLYGWRLYGDYGILSPQSVRYPSFYIIKLMRYFARGGDTVVQATSDNPLLAVYAVKRANGSLTLLLINKSPNQAQPASIWINDYVPDPQSGATSYGIPQDEAARTANGSPDLAQATFATAGTLFNYSFAPYSAAVISLIPTTGNRIDDARIFVTQHYQDFLNRQPDTSGLVFWTNEILFCGGDQQCIEIKRINVSAAYFLSIEFQQTGYLVERMYKAAYGDGSGASTFNGAHQLPVPIVRFNEFVSDTQQIGQGVIVGQAGWETALENNKQTFAAQFVQRARFASAFATSMPPAQFVDALFANAGVTPTATDRDAAIAEFGSATTTSDLAARARVLRKVAENSTLVTNEFNRAFVLMQFFGYLRRDPNNGPDTDYTGYDFWLTKLNQFNGNFVNAEMVKAFITSGEYRSRFGPP